jgi:AbrB family looped-hinge helix DNA binding protein
VDPEYSFSWADEKTCVEYIVEAFYVCKESKEAAMELAKVTSKGQITIPLQIRKRLKLKEGDKVFFLEEQGRIIVRNAAQAALDTFQDEMAGEAAKAEFSTEDDVFRYIKALRTGSGS